MVDLNRLIEEHGKQTVFDTIFSYYGWDSMQEMANSDTYQERYQEHFEDKGSDTLARRETLKDLIVPTERGVTLPGFFLGTREFTDDDDNVEERRAQVLRPDGRSGTYGSGLDLDLPNLSPVEFGPMVIQENIVEGTERIIPMADNNGEVDVAPADHNEPLPSGSLQDTLNRIDGGLDEDGDVILNDRGVIHGSSYGNVTVVMTIEEGQNAVNWTSPEEDDEYNPEGVLQVRLRDTDGNVVRAKLPIEETQQTFNLDDHDSYYDYREALEGERVVVRGSVGVTYPADYSDLKEDYGEAVDEFLDTLDDSGLLVGYRDYTTDDGREERLRAIDLTRTDWDDDEYTISHPDIKDGMSEIEFYDIREEAPGEWEFDRHMSDTRSGVPWMHVRGDDGFVVFLSERNLVDEGDRLAEMADMIPDSPIEGDDDNDTTETTKETTETESATETETETVTSGAGTEATSSSFVE